jgi:steroid delta-isomerase-like uncharacterized protein
MQRNCPVVSSKKYGTTKTLPPSMNSSPANYVHHDPQSPKFSDGVEGYKQLVAHYLNAFPDARFTIDQETQEGDTAVTRWRVQGTHKGDLPKLPATNKSFSVAGVTIARSKDGKIVEGWNIWDALGLM